MIAKAERNAEILRRYMSGEKSMQDLADEYRVSRQRIEQIIHVDAQRARNGVANKVRRFFGKDQTEFAASTHVVRNALRIAGVPFEQGRRQSFSVAGKIRISRGGNSPWIVRVDGSENEVARERDAGNLVRIVKETLAAVEPNEIAA